MELKSEVPGVCFVQFEWLRRVLQSRPLQVVLSCRSPDASSVLFRRFARSSQLLSPPFDFP